MSLLTNFASRVDCDWAGWDSAWRNLCSYSPSKKSSKLTCNIVQQRCGGSMFPGFAAARTEGILQSRGRAEHCRCPIGSRHAPATEPPPASSTHPSAAAQPRQVGKWFTLSATSRRNQITCNEWKSETKWNKFKGSGNDMNGIDVARWGSGPAVVAILEQTFAVVVLLVGGLRLSFILLLLASPWTCTEVPR